jgi:hypothetical protein
MPQKALRMTFGSSAAAPPTSSAHSCDVTGACSSPAFFWTRITVWPERSPPMNMSGCWEWLPSGSAGGGYPP